MIDNTDITVVVQGPIQATSDRAMETGVTARCIAGIRKHFPGAFVLVSTWEGMDAEGLDYDRIIYSPDPGPTIIKYDKQDRPYTININRQLVSTLAGLRAVTTPYAMKLRSDNVLHSAAVKELFERFLVRSELNRFMRQRLVSSNLFAKEYASGLPIPFFPSDFFQFGLTEDLIALWDIPWLDDFEYDPQSQGKRQHISSPWPQICTEQIIWTRFISKFRQLDFKHKLDYHGGNKQLSHQVLANNLVIADRDQLGLEVPPRLQHPVGFPYRYFTHRRWLQLYRQYCDPDVRIDGNFAFTVRFTLARVVMYLRRGWRRQLKLARIMRREYRVDNPSRS